MLNQCEVDLAYLNLVLWLDSTTIYYTLSTIAQTLAGALAVLVAIVLFNFARANDAMQNGLALDPAGAPSTRRRTRRGFLKQFASQRQLADRYYMATKVRPRLYRAIALSLVDVAMCFAALPLTPTLAENCPVAGVLLTTTSGLGIVCLVLYWQLAVAVIRLG